MGRTQDSTSARIMRKEAMRRYVNGASQREVEREFGVSRQRVNYWRKRDKWGEARERLAAMSPVSQDVKELLKRVPTVEDAALDILRREFVVLMQDLVKMGRHAGNTPNRVMAIKAYADICKMLGIVTRKDLNPDDEAPMVESEPVETGEMAFDDSVDTLEAMYREGDADVGLAGESARGE